MLGELLCIRIQYILICRFDINIIVQHYNYNNLTTCRILLSVAKRKQHTCKYNNGRKDNHILCCSYLVTIIIISHFRRRDP